MSNAHDRVIAAAAKAELGPLGFKRKGRSRLWLLDHGDWLNIVGFVPSKWSVSVQRDNAAHFIWAGHGFMSLDHSVRGRHVDYESDEQFTSALTEIAREAAVEACQIEEQFSSFEKIASFVIDRAQHSDRMGPSWFGFQAGLAAGILGDMQMAERFLHGISDDRVIPYARRFHELIAQPKAFISEINNAVAKQRSALNLEPLESIAF